MPEVIKAEYRIVTPMFIGDANQQATGISPASVKGALRFWWRALNWGRIRSEANSDEAALKGLHKQEGYIFGSSAEKSTGQSQFLIRIRANKDLDKGAKLTDKPKPGVQYLLGQGLYHFRENYKREAIQSGSFIVECVLRPSSKAKLYKKQLAESLLALGLLGGLGSRSRKGLGSVAIQSISDDSFKVPTSVKELKEVINQWRQAAPSPPFTAFSALSRVDISITGSNALELLNQAGSEQQLYRSYGRKGSHDSFHKVAGKQAEQNFKTDHDSMLKVGNGQRPSSIPERSVFGLPHNYFFSGSNLNIEYSVGEKDRSRRASPLFIHTHVFPNGDAALLQTLLPAQFLGDGSKLEFKVKKKKPTSIAFKSSMINWDTIRTYLNRFTDREQIL